MINRERHASVYARRGYEITVKPLTTDITRLWLTEFTRSENYGHKEFDGLPSSGVRKNLISIGIDDFSQDINDLEIQFQSCDIVCTGDHAFIRTILNGRELIKPSTASCQSSAISLNIAAYGSPYRLRTKD